MKLYLEYVGSAVFSMALLLALSITTLVTHLTFSPKERGYSYNNFTFSPYYLMIANCVSLMVEVIILMVGSQTIQAWVFLIMTMQVQVLTGSWAVAIQLCEWILCGELVRFQGKTPLEELDAKKDIFQNKEKRILRNTVNCFSVCSFLVLLSPFFFHDWRNQEARFVDSMHAFWTNTLVMSCILCLYCFIGTIFLIIEVRQYMRSYYLEFRVRILIQSLASLAYIIVQIIVSSIFRKVFIDKNSDS